jgi:toxin ParE1/3/4
MKVRFTAQADADIIDCYLYGYVNFGRDQVERYEQGLRHAIDVIADNPRIAAERQEYTPPVRVHHHAKHFISYLIEDTHVLIVRVLRDAVDLTKHLRSAS